MEIGGWVLAAHFFFHPRKAAALQRTFELIVWAQDFLVKKAAGLVATYSRCVSDALPCAFHSAEPGGLEASREEEEGGRGACVQIK